MRLIRSPSSGVFRERVYNAGLSDPLRGIGGYLPNEFWQQRTNRRDAQRLLIRMRRFEHIARHREALDGRADLSARRIMSLRTRKQQRYRRLTGIEIDERAFVLPLLEELADTGDTTVAEAIHEFRVCLRNGLGADGGEESSASGDAAVDSMTVPDGS